MSILTIPIQCDTDCPSKYKKQEIETKGIHTGKKQAK
jgi:hypothetical protein